MQESWNKHFDKSINYVKALSVGGAILYLLKKSMKHHGILYGILSYRMVKSFGESATVKHWRIDAQKIIIKRLITF